MSNPNQYPNLNEQNYRGQNQGYQQLYQQPNQPLYNNSNNVPATNQNQTNYAQNGAQNAGNMFHMNMQHGAQLHQGQFYDKQNTLQGSARKGFIKKVYTLVTIQLLVTMIIGYVAYNNSTFQSIFFNTPMIAVLSVVLMGLSCAMACCTQTIRKCALPFFIAFTLIFAILIGISICGYKSKVILTAAGITFLLSLALTTYACFTKTDMTTCGPYLMIFCLVLLVFGIVAIFWRDPMVQLIYSCLSALLFGIYLIFDTQLVLGRFQNAYSLDDAYFAAIQIYIDIIQLFLHILRIVAAFDR